LSLSSRGEVLFRGEYGKGLRACKVEGLTGARRVCLEGRVPVGWRGVGSQMAH